MYNQARILICKWLLLWVDLILCINVFGQKPPIDTTAFKEWPTLGTVDLSDDGKFIEYEIENSPVGHRSLILESTDGKWKESILDGLKVSFGFHCTEAIVLGPGDSLKIIKLGTAFVESIPHVKKAAVVGNSNDEMLVYWLKEKDKRIVLYNFQTGHSKTYFDVDNFILSRDRENLILKRGREGKEDFLFEWVNASSDSAYTVYIGNNASNFVFSKDNSEVAFTVAGVDEKSGKICRLFKPGMEESKVLALESTSNLDAKLRVDYIRRFSIDGLSLFVRLEMDDSAVEKKANLTIWSYKDSKLPTAPSMNGQKRTYEAIFHLDSGKLEQLQFDNEPTWRSTLLEKSQSQFALIDHRNGDVEFGERNWNPYTNGIEYLVELRTGRRTAIMMLSGFQAQGFTLSPDEKFVVYYDINQENFYSYEIKLKKWRNITKKIVTDWQDKEIEYPNKSIVINAISGWMKGGRYVLLHDEYDIWMVDLLGVDSPKNITNGYGRKKKIVFRLAMETEAGLIDESQLLYLSAFDKNNKDNGFYSKIVSESGDPKLLTMGQYVYEAPGNITNLQGMEPIKAKDSVIFIVRRMSCSEFPNYFSTKDFKTFTRLSELHPEEKYNWLRSELVNFKSSSGAPLQGALYKPEDFDSSKKYPIIFYYYEKKSDAKNVYLRPEYSHGDLNLPWYVSNGYIVFSPDIHYVVGQVGKSALEGVVSAANYIVNKPWINKNRMGLQGISFGGYETNYIVTHSHLFAAACSASGLADLVSSYGGLSDGGSSFEEMYEVGQFRIGKSLPESPNLYIENSPIFYTRDVTTPLLLMHTTKDGICPISNIIEFFTALRRLGQKVWLLQYEEGSHAIWGESSIDFTERMRQFFDHYLKGLPAPQWMN